MNPKILRVLIWGKTYPELSTQHWETVCTGGCSENGKPLRLYPVPLRYLPLQQQYSLYDWVEVSIIRNTKDPRPESHRLVSDEIKVIDNAPTTNGWRERRQIIFSDTSWHYQCLEDLKERQRIDALSLGLIKVGEITDVTLRKRPKEDEIKHQRKLLKLKNQFDIFRGELRDLDFFPYRVHVEWRCERLNRHPPCPGHTASVLDWGLSELARREGPEVAKKRMEDLSDLSKYDLRFFMGNFRLYPQSFGIIGLWYPLIREVQQLDLFTTG